MSRWSKTCIDYLIDTMTAWLGLILLLAANTAPAQLTSASDSLRSRVRWSPESPVQGSIIRLTVTPVDREWASTGPLSVAASIAGESLHFERGADGLFHALAGIPATARDSVSLTLVLEDGVWSERLDTYLPVARGKFTATRLSVDPRFTDRPDSALTARIAAERDSVQVILSRTHDTPRMWDSDFIRPRTTRVTSDFGQRRMFNGELRSRHWGTDLAGDVGAPVVATNRGVVALAGDFYYAGGLVYLDHGAGLLTAYMHLSEISVVVGDTVVRGQEIGRVGASGRVTGPHLHWIARYGPVLVNPLGLLELDLDGWLEGS
jgi:hypothetical protein